MKVVLSDGEQIETTMFHPFYVQREKEASGTWTAASNLVSGDKLLMENGKSVYVESIQIEKLEKAIKVYNLEIEGLHTYYVGNGVLVHNVCTPQEMNKKKAEALEGRDIEFRKLDDALYFIAKKFPGFNEETAGHRSAEGWHFDKHPIGDSIEDIVHINLYGKVYKFRIHITWLD